MTLTRLIIVSILASVTLYFAEPPYSFTPFGVLGLVLALYLIERVKHVFIVIFLMGLLKSLLSMLWLKEVGFYYIPWIGVSIYLGLWWGIWGMLCRLFKKHGVSYLISAPLLFLILEYLRSMGSLGFPWLLLGYDFFSLALYRQMADAIGVYGLGFYLVLISALVYEWLKGRRLKNFILLSILTILPPIYGYYQRSKHDDTSKKVYISLLQGNLDSRVPWNAKYAYKCFKRYEEMLREASLNPRSRWIILPETAVPYYILDEDFFDWLGLFRELSTFYDKIFIFGIASQAGEKHHNSLVYADRTGIVRGIYSKRQLVPFGEFVPYGKQFPFLRRLIVHSALFDHGNENLLLQPDGIKLGSFICYEIIFPELVSRDVDRGAEVLLNVTNDIWFGRSIGPYQHAIMSCFRSIENKRYLIRCANSGLSFICSPYGDLQVKTKIMEKRIIDGYFIPLHEKTIYSRIKGFIFPFAVLMLLMSICIKKRCPGSITRAS